MLSECSLMLGLLWRNRRAEGAGSSWKDFRTTTLLKSAGSVCEWYLCVYDDLQKLLFQVP